MTCASGLVTLDGTPTKRLWELSLGERVKDRQVLSEAERREYVRNGLNLNLVRTSEHLKLYNWADHVNTDQDTALLGATHSGHDERPVVITTTTAELVYENSDAADHIADTRHYRNGLHERCVGTVARSNRYGDDYLKK